MVFLPTLKFYACRIQIWLSLLILFKKMNILNFLDKCIKKYLSKLFVSKRIVHTLHKKQVRLVLPFLDPLSFEIRSRLQKRFRNYIPYCSLKIVYLSRSRVSNLFNFKDVVNTKSSSHIVYKFMCSCCNATYYGQTQRHFFARASEHLTLHL